MSIIHPPVPELANYYVSMGAVSSIGGCANTCSHISHTSKWIILQRGLNHRVWSLYHSATGLKGCWLTKILNVISLTSTSIDIHPHTLSDLLFKELLLVLYMGPISWGKSKFRYKLLKQEKETYFNAVCSALLSALS